MARKSSPAKRGRSRSRGPASAKKSPSKPRSKSRSRARSKTPTRATPSSRKRSPQKKAATSPRKTPARSPARGKSPGRGKSPSRNANSTAVASPAPSTMSNVRQRIIAAERSAARSAASVTKPVTKSVGDFFSSIRKSMPTLRAPAYRYRRSQKWYIYRGHNIILLLVLFALLAASTYFAYHYRAELHKQYQYASNQASEQFNRLRARWYKK